MLLIEDQIESFKKDLIKLFKKHKVSLKTHSVHDTQGHYIRTNSYVGFDDKLYNKGTLQEIYIINQQL